MTSNQYYQCLLEVDSYADIDAYVSDMALSSIWGTETSAIDENRIFALQEIWHAAHRSIQDIAAAAGMSQRQLARRFGIGYRTMENWVARDSCLLHVRLMMQEALGLYKVDVSDGKE